MKTIVVGLGSMGQRRIRLLQKLYPEMSICGVDTQPERRDGAASKWAITVYPDIGYAVDIEKPDAALICTSPLSHAPLIRDCLKKNLHVFTELNLVTDGYLENMDLAEKNGKVLFLSSTFQYRDEPMYMSQQARAQSKKLSYRYHVGQYLPDWHPWENYTNYFVGDVRTSGCRELLAIELPWLIQAFGEIESFCVSKRKLTTLKTTYDDCIHLLLNHKNGNVGSLCVDVVSRKAKREFEVIGEELYITWEGTPDSLKLYDVEKKMEHVVNLTPNIDRQDGYASFVVENAYASELKCFFDVVNGNAILKYGFAEDLKILQLIDRIEAAQ
ncbi:MAG: Gfo/Idh/MocA family oxidoreductase [Clostridia bacterium]